MTNGDKFFWRKSRIKVAGKITDCQGGGFKGFGGENSTELIKVISKFLGLLSS